MNRTALLMTAVSGLIVLSACSQQSAGAAPAEATTPAAATAAKAVLPGLWEVTRTSTDEAPEVDEDCITPDEADWSAQALKSSAAANCKLVRSEIGGGRIDVRMSCGAAAGTGMGASESRMSGVYTPTTYDVAFAMQTTVGGEKVEFVTKAKGRRIAAACPAEAAD